MVTAPRSAILRQLFAIQDSQRVTNKELGYRTALPNDIISQLRTGRQQGTIEKAEKIAAALGYEIVLRPRLPGDKR